MKVKIESIDIREGKRHDERKCALALALKRQTGHPAAVYANAVVVYANRYDHRYEISQPVRDFVNDFDSGRPCHPMTIDLGKAEAWDREGGEWQWTSRPF